MSRKPRKKSSTGIYHVMLRGINRQIIFEDNEDKHRMLETLEKYKSICKYQLFGYCLMDNHIHLLMKETEENISLSIKRICSSYVYWYNKKYERCGHLFQDRFRSECVESRSSFLTVLRYIHQNPLKAGLAASIFDSKWTSIHEYTHQPQMVDTQVALRLFSPDKNEALKLFIKFTAEHNDDKCLDYDVVVRKLSDEEVVDCLLQAGVKNISELQHMAKEEREPIILKLKKLNGVTVKQLSRVTGLSKSVIYRATSSKKKL